MSTKTTRSRRRIISQDHAVKERKKEDESNDVTTRNGSREHTVEEEKKEDKGNNAATRNVSQVHAGKAPATQTKTTQSRRTRATRSPPKTTYKTTQSRKR
jgi:hypothetical protein